MKNMQSFYRQNEAFCSEPLHYKECGLDNIYLRNGFSIDEYDGEPYVTISDLDGLHQAIGLHIVLARKAPSGKELRFLRSELDMSQAELARILGVSDQSVARWEKEQSDANGAGVFSLRMIYLLSLVPDQKRTLILNGMVSRMRELAEMDETSDDVVLTYTGTRWDDVHGVAA